MLYFFSFFLCPRQLKAGAMLLNILIFTTPHQQASKCLLLFSTSPFLTQAKHAKINANTQQQAANYPFVFMTSHPSIHQANPSPLPSHPMLCFPPETEKGPK